MKPNALLALAFALPALAEPPSVDVRVDASLADSIHQNTRSEDQLHQELAKDHELQKRSSSAGTCVRTKPFFFFLFHPSFRTNQVIDYLYRLEAFGRKCRYQA